MKFDLDAVLAEILNGELTPARVATPATNRANVASVAGVAAQPAEIPAPAKVLTFPPQPSAPAPSRLDGTASIGIADDAPRTLCNVTGRPMTWTGKVVSLDAWRRLPAWERHGPDGRLFCGVCRGWVAPIAFPYCHDGGAA